MKYFFIAFLFFCTSEVLPSTKELYKRKFNDCLIITDPLGFNALSLEQELQLLRTYIEAHKNDLAKELIKRLNFLLFLNKDWLFSAQASAEKSNNAYMYHYIQMKIDTFSPYLPTKQEEKTYDTYLLDALQRGH